MYDIRQFRPSLYALLILGITGFAIAAYTPAMWVLAVGGILIHLYLVRNGRFRPMPRLLANGITLLAVLYVLVVVRQTGGTPILLIGQFLVLLHLVKLYELRANRDYAQLIVLSLLLIVAAAISTATLAFGVIFVAYLFLSLYCCLLFHLKVETDHAKNAMGLTAENVNPATLRQDQRFLGRSMRRITQLVAVYAVALAIAVFVTFPRGAGANMFGPLQLRPSQAMTGFSEQMSFQNIAQISQNNQRVAYVKVFRNEEPWGGTAPLYLRGMVYDTYSGSDAAQGQLQWYRNPRPTDDLIFDADPGRTFELGSALGGDRFRQEIFLDPTGVRTIFAMPGPLSIVLGSDDRYVYSERDDVIQAQDALMRPLRYEVVSSNRVRQPTGRQRVAQSNNINLRLDAVDPTQGRGSPRRQRSEIAPEIAAYALKPEVSGEFQGWTVQDRENGSKPPRELHTAIATNIERHLRDEPFSYTLDLTGARELREMDPMVWFLSERGKRGHCEYFAGAMMLLCQSLGMEARVVTGFKSDEFNTWNSTYTVRHSHAHAWVEVLGDDGEWRMFDPTTGRGAGIAGSSMLSWWDRTRGLFNFLEYSWANWVVAYDRESRTNLITAVDTQLTSTAVSTSQNVGSVRKWFSQWNFYLLSSKVLSVIIYLMVLAMVAAVAWFLWERRRLKRRARRIGLADLPQGEQLRLARQLAFYDGLLRMLEKHDIRRAPHLTPREFSESLAFLPPEASDQVRKLTGIFYRIRYGHQEVSPVQRRRLESVIDEIERSISSSRLAY